MYFLFLALYALGICVFGAAILMFIVKKEQIKAIVTAIIGILIMVGTSLI